MSFPSDSTRSSSKEGTLYSSITAYSNEHKNVEKSKDNDFAINHEMLKKYLPAAFQLMCAWWLSNYFYKYSLALTSLTSTTITSDMECVFTFLLALMFKEERFCKRKFIGVVLAFTGAY